MRILAILGAMLLAVSATGCGSDNDDGNSGGSGGVGGIGGSGATGGSGGEGGSGGDGGTGGSGGGFISDAEGCELYCEVQDNCGALDEADMTMDECIDYCEYYVLSQFSEELITRCFTCLGGVSCNEWETSCIDECTASGYDFILETTGFTQWIGKSFYIQATVDGELAIADSWVIGVEVDADVELSIPGFFKGGEAVVVDYYVDVDDDASCSAVDHAGHLEIPSVNDDVRVVVSSADPSNAAACTAFPLNLVVRGSGLGDVVGRWFGIEILNPDGSVLIDGGWVIDSESFETGASGIFTLGETYTINYFIDIDGDAACTEADLAVSFTVPVTGTVTVEVSLDETSNVAACASFTAVPKHFILDGTDFGAYEGSVAAATVLYYYELFGTPFWIPMDTGTATITDGAFRIEIPYVFEGDELALYGVDWFIEANGDQICSAADVGGSLGAIEGPFTSNVTRTVTAADAGNLVCESFPEFAPGILVTATGFDDYNGRRFEVFLVNPDDPSVEVSLKTGRVADGGFEVVLELEDTSIAYEIYWFVDRDGSMWCNLPEDMAGRVAVPVITGARTPVSITPVEESDAAACNAINDFWG